MAVLKYISAIYLILLLPASSVFAQEHEACPNPHPHTENWVVHEESEFHLLLPPSLREAAVFEVDSEGGRWVGDGMVVSYDYGFYSPPLIDDDVQNLEARIVCQEIGESRQPRIIYFEPGGEKYAIGAHWPNLQEEHGRIWKLTVVATSDRETDLPRLMAVIRSVHFYLE